MRLRQVATGGQESAPVGEAAKWPPYLPLFVGTGPSSLQVRVEFRPRRQPVRDVTLPAGATVRDLLAAVGEPADHTLVVRGDQPVTESEPLRDGEDLLLLSAFSGG